MLKIIEELRETVQLQGEEIGRLKDEIAILKGEKARPQLKPSRMVLINMEKLPGFRGNQH